MNGVKRGGGIRLKQMCQIGSDVIWLSWVQWIRQDQNDFIKRNIPTPLSEHCVWAHEHVSSMSFSICILYCMSFSKCRYRLIAYSGMALAIHYINLQRRSPNFLFEREGGCQGPEPNSQGPGIRYPRNQKLGDLLSYFSTRHKFINCKNELRFLSFVFVFCLKCFGDMARCPPFRPSL